MNLFKKAKVINSKPNYKSISDLSESEQAEIRKHFAKPFIDSLLPQCPNCGNKIPESVHGAMVQAGIRSGDKVGSECPECKTNFTYRQP